MLFFELPKCLTLTPSASYLALSQWLVDTMRLSPHETGHARIPAPVMADGKKVPHEEERFLLQLSEAGPFPPIPHPRQAPRRPGPIAPEFHQHPSAIIRGQAMREKSLMGSFLLFCFGEF